MAGTQNSISSLLEQFLRLEKNALAIVAKLSEVVTSSNETVEIELTAEDGTTQTFMVPSFGYLNSKIDRVDNTTQSLAGLGDSSAVIRLPDGTTKKIFEASIIRDPEPISTLAVPAQFKVRNNWFFESFLNPLLYISFDVTGLVPDNMKKAFVKRLIFNTTTQSIKDYFDQNYKGRNDIDYTDLLVDLDAQGITYFTDDEIVDLPVSVMRYRGNFDILKVVDEEVQITSNNKTITTKKRKYKLDKISYTDILSGTTDSKTLQLNDVLLTADGTKYKIESIDTAERTVVLKRTQGSQALTMGTDVLTIYSPPYSVKEIQINVGHDERQVIFVKPIDADFDVASSTYSPGVAMFTNELIIATGSGNKTLDDFYKSDVTDFGQQFINSAKEKQVPAVYGVAPIAPALTETNFQVVLINEHKKDTKEVDAIRQKLATKVELENQIKQLEEAINSKKNDLNNNSSTRSDAEKRKIKADLDTLAKEKASKVNLYSSVVKELSTKSKENPVVAESAKYRVRGFWPIPDAQVSDKTQPQEIIQFKIAYRYIKKDGNAAGTKELEFVDNDGTVKSGAFSNWTEFKSDIRRRVYNVDTGFYEWAIEDVSDADTVNINQLDIPISKGEKVQVRIKSISEAGYPLNPIESEWSDIVTIDFPDDLQISDDSVGILSEIGGEEIRVKFQEELNARSLDLHLLNSFPSGDRYFGHTADNIASGFFTAEGKVIDLFEKLKGIDTELQRLKQLIERAKGTLVLYLLDETGNVIKITPNSTNKIFAGFYKDLIKSGSGNTVTYEHGKIITKTYVLRAENSAATALELASLFPGGQGTLTPTSNPSSPATSQDYDTNRRYDIVPIATTGVSQPTTGTLKHEPPFQSQQCKSLWLYNRYKSVGLDETLYAPYGTGGLTSTLSDAYNYQGQTISASLYPLNGPYLLPYQPSWAGPPGTSADSNVWNGTLTGTVANGGGRLSEFCIHKDHPDLVTADSIATYSGGTTWQSGSFRGSISSLVLTRYPKFTHGLYFNEDITSVSYGKKQLQATPAVTYTSGTIYDKHFPPKIGFYSNDEYLVGKFTCGAYLYTAPVAYDDIAVDGNTDLAKRTLEFGEDKGINIPIIFQFRCSDKLGYVGGFRNSGTISNITYTKKIGVDIAVKNDSTFSFDLEFTAKYQNDSLSAPVFAPNVSLERLSSIRNQSSAG